MDEEAIMHKLSINLKQPEHFTPGEVLDLLMTVGNNWKLVWEELPTLMIFDQIYANSDLDAFIYQSTLFVRHPDRLREFQWDVTDSPETILEWLLENTPLECCTFVSDLYSYARDINDDASPWTLFIFMTNDLEDDTEFPIKVPIGNNDAVYLGRALECWGEYADVMQPYTDLLLRFQHAQR